MTSIPDQVNLPGDTVSLTLNSGDATGGNPTFSETGLPSGLSINSATGEISGTIASGAASSSPYSVTVTATDGGVSVSQSFNWSVQSIILADPGDQYNADGDSVNISSILARARTGDLICYSGAGLPAGLSINSTSGVISGTIASNADAGGPYSVTVTATDSTSNASASETFTWNVSQPGTLVSITPPSQYRANQLAALRNQLNAAQNEVLLLEALLETNGILLASQLALVVADRAVLATAPTGVMLLKARVDLNRLNQLLTSRDTINNDLNKEQRTVQSLQRQIRYFNLFFN